MVVVLVDVVADSHDQFLDIAEDAAPKAVLSEVAEESLHHVEPGTAGGGEVHMEAPMAGQPLVDLGMFVRGIVIRDQIDLLACRGDLVNHAQEFQPLLMPVPVVAHADYGAIESAHGRKQGLPARSAATVDPM